MSAATILVIDDDKLIRWSLSTVLGRAGYRVHEAATGKDGLAAVRDQRPDLVLLDIRLPDMDGITVLEQIRRRHPELPVLTMTAHGTSETAHVAVGLGARGHLEKPCDPTLLLAAVSRVLESTTPPNRSSP